MSRRRVRTRQSPRWLTALQRPPAPQLQAGLTRRPVVNGPGSRCPVSPPTPQVQPSEPTCPFGDGPGPLLSVPLNTGRPVRLRQVDDGVPSALGGMVSSCRWAGGSALGFTTHVAWQQTLHREAFQVLELGRGGSRLTLALRNQRWPPSVQLSRCLGAGGLCGESLRSPKLFVKVSNSRHPMVTFSSAWGPQDGTEDRNRRVLLRALTCPAAWTRHSGFRTAAHVPLLLCKGESL